MCSLLIGFIMYACVQCVVRGNSWQIRCLQFIGGKDVVNDYCLYQHFCQNKEKQDYVLLDIQ